MLAAQEENEAAPVSQSARSPPAAQAEIGTVYLRSTRYGNNGSNRHWHWPLGK